MLNYRGQFRVVYETDKHTGKPSEFSFVPCRIKKGSNICRYDVNTLNVYIPSSVIAVRLHKEFPHLFRSFQMGEKEWTLLFPESMMKEATVILKPIVLGKNISPRSKRSKRFAQNM